MNLLKPIPADSPGKMQAIAVIVLYGMTPEQSPAFRSLLEARSNLAPEVGRVAIRLWDNSPSQLSRTFDSEDVAYCHDGSNPGLATAYNHALGVAAERGFEWLITLDQDTRVPRDYLLRMASAARLFAFHPGIGAIVPQIAAGPKQLSPHRFVLGAIPNWYRPGFRGAPNEQVSAFNSGAMLRVDALKQIGGYDLRFPLDHSDIVMFHRLHQHGKRVFIDGEIQLQHEFSMVDMNRSMSARRYSRGLVTESAFWDQYMNGLAGCERTLRLLMRTFRHWLRGDRRELRRITWAFLRIRIFRSKRFRLQKWQESLGEMASTFGNDAGARPKVSVCMAAFNGARFIRPQLESILPQLLPGDEIVVVDDGSNDETVASADAFGDARIRVFVHERNQGVVATFEDAVRAATGDILFLCDDDDLWAPSKVQRVLREFESRPDVCVVTSRVALIDENGNRLPDARVNRHGRFFSGFWRNVLMNHYQGSAMAIRASFLGQVLPFPRRKLFLHDVWIGTRNAALGGKTRFIDEPLVYYRRHARNASQMHGLLQCIRVRIDLLFAHLFRTLGGGPLRLLPRR